MEVNTIVSDLLESTEDINNVIESLKYAIARYNRQKEAMTTSEAAEFVYNHPALQRREQRLNVALSTMPKVTTKYHYN